MAARVTSIEVQVEPFCYGFDVRVVPAPVGVGHDREFRTIPEARNYAALLARATGWPVIDNARDADASPAIGSRGPAS